MYTRFLLFILFSSCALHLWGQKSITIQSIDDDGTVLSRNWKWHAGDNTAWAGPDFNDQDWEKIVPTSHIQTLSKLREAQIGWFRRPIKVAPGLAGKPLYLNIHQIGASEIYLDGKLLQKVGLVSINPAKEVPRLQASFIPISFPDTNLHVLAVRFSFTKANFYYPGTSRKTFELRLVDIIRSGENIFNEPKLTTGIICLCIGIFLVFSILHFSFFVSNRRQKVSLYLGFTMLFFVFTLLSTLLENSFRRLTFEQINELIGDTSFYCGILFINASLYLYLNRPFRTFFYLQALIMVISVGCHIFAISLPLVLEVWPFFLLIFIDFIRVSILADKQRNPNAKVPIYSLLTVAGCFIIVIIFSVLMGTFIQDYKSIENYIDYITLFTIGLFMIMCLSIPVGLSFSLVREYSRTHQALRKKIQETEALSAKNLAHEQEKQQLLANQNELLEMQVTERTAELESSLETLKTTQAQLIQSEKLAGLGELTAGIAHEIQNPLNFVNNFSEVSVELVDEMHEELDKGDWTETKAIANDIKQNLHKISHHGKRAGNIVKGMLEHSRQATGERELTDMNALADEYLRLAYHGLRAKDRDFNSGFSLEPDENLPKIHLVAQDMGRVLLNLINNAFYAVNERRKSGETGYQPKVTVKTQTVDHQIEVRVSDNGTGISEGTKAKIFQPFFTTKPTGQGTGLGLSLAYDIVTKGHGGTIEAESQEGEGTVFIIRLPVI
ncbi:MAG: ATP-binding protein [Spirosomataceae bacterium]